MKSIVCFIALTFAQAAIAQSTDGGFVGLTISTTDPGLVTDIVPDTPAANSPIHVGDRIVSFGPTPISHIHSSADFRKATSGVPGSEITVRVRPAHTHATIRVRLRRVGPRKIPPDFNRYQVSSDTNDLTMRWSERLAGLVPHLP
jgi:C-terminal processing protease CtpA/Prc